MDVVCGGPFRARSFVWQPRRGAFAQAIVCKATFALLPGESPLHAEPLDVLGADAHCEGDPQRSLACASDLVPLKKRCEILITGHAYAPEGRAVPSLVARLAFQEVDKVIGVVGDMHLSLDGKFSAPVPFSKMPLRWERTAGGPDTQNPVGVRMGREARADPWGRVFLPNLRPLDAHPSSRWDVLPPVGFGPIAPDWPARVMRLHRYAQSVDPRRVQEWPLPDDFDMAFFNAAPSDQLVDEIEGREQILLEGLSPRAPRLTTQLARVAPRAHAELAGGAHSPMTLRCDTLAIDTDRETATLVWRGHVVVDHPERVSRIVISAQALTSRIAVPAEPRRASVKETIGISGALPGFVLPFGMPDKLAGKRPAAAPSPEPPAEAMTPVPPIAQAVAPPPPSSPVVSAPSPSSLVNAQVVSAPPPSLSQSAQIVSAPPGAPVGAPAEPPEPEPQFAEAVRKTVDLSAWGRPQSSADPLPFRPAPPVNEAEAPRPPPAEPVHVLAALPLEPVHVLAALPAIETRPREPEFAPLPTPENVAPAQPAMLGVLAELHPPRPAGEDAAPAEPEPFSIDRYPLERCARIAARLARRPEDADAILEDEKVPADHWETAGAHWLYEIRAEAARGKNKHLVAYDAAFVAELEAERGPITAQDHARLVLAAERAGAGELLDAMSLPRASLPRIQRVWLRRIMADAAAAKQVRAALRSLEDE